MLSPLSREASVGILFAKATHCEKSLEYARAPRMTTLFAPAFADCSGIAERSKGPTKVADAGGQVLGEPMEIPGVGQYVSFTDTKGNRVSMAQPIPRNWHARKSA
jgi:hypothetical protein